MHGTHLSDDMAVSQLTIQLGKCLLNQYNLLCHFRLVELTQRKEEEEEIEVRLDIQDNLTVLEEIKTIEENERKEVINLILRRTNPLFYIFNFALVT